MDEGFPVMQLVHYDMGLDTRRIYRPEEFGGEMRILSSPFLITGNPECPYRANLSMALYKASSKMRAEILECDTRYWSGKQEQFNRFMEYHMSRPGWEPPRSDAQVSWSFPQA